MYIYNQMSNILLTMDRSRKKINLCPRETEIFLVVAEGWGQEWGIIVKGLMERVPLGWWKSSKLGCGEGCTTL